MDLEELHRVVVQGFASVNARFDSVDGRLTGVEDRLTAVEGRLTGVEARLTGVEGRLTSVEGKVDNLQIQMERVKDAVMEHGRQLKDIHAALDRKVDRDELEARH